MSYTIKSKIPREVTIQLFPFCKGPNHACTDFYGNLGIWAYFSVSSFYSDWPQPLIVTITTSYFLYLWSVLILEILYFYGITHDLLIDSPEKTSVSLQSLELTITMYFNFLSSLSPRRLLPILLSWVCWRRQTHNSDASLKGAVKPAGQFYLVFIMYLTACTSVGPYSVWGFLNLLLSRVGISDPTNYFFSFLLSPNK